MISDCDLDLYQMLRIIKWIFILNINLEFLMLAINKNKLYLVLNEYII